MAFTFDPALSTDADMVRFEIGDVNSAGHYLEDETIQYFVTHGSVGQAVIECLQYIITQLSVPDFRLDWMSVSNAQARAGFESMLKQKGQKFNIYDLTPKSSIAHAHRADSYENDNGVYTLPDGAP